MNFRAEVPLFPSFPFLPSFFPSHVILSKARDLKTLTKTDSRIFT